MGNNLIVDVSSINGAISKVNQLYAEATKSRFYVINKWSSPIAIESGVQPLKIEANIIPSTAIRTGWTKDTVFITYGLTIPFTGKPSVTATYDGNVKGVTIRTNVVNGANNGKDTITFYVTRPSGVWKQASDSFNIHFIAIGY